MALLQPYRDTTRVRRHKDGCVLEFVGPNKNEIVWLTRYFFEKFNKACLATHFSWTQPKETFIKVMPTTVMSKRINFVCHVVADKSYADSLATVYKEGDKVNYGIEACPKMSFVNALTKRSYDEILAVIREVKIFQDSSYRHLEHTIREVTRIIKNALERKNLKLWHVSLDFGYSPKSEGENDILLTNVLWGSWLVTDERGRKVGLQEVVRAMRG